MVLALQKLQMAFYRDRKVRYTKVMKAKVSMMNIFKNPRYRGQHVILAAGKIYTAKTGEGAAEILRKIGKTYPDVTPEVVYLPKGSLTV